MRTDQEVMYRYENHADVVLLERYPVTKRTPQGAWIDVYGKPRFVLSNTFKKFAAATEEEEAKVSFFARKARQLKILRAQIQAVEGAVEALTEGRLRDYGGSAFRLDY